MEDSVSEYERKASLAIAIQGQIAQVARVEAQSDYQAVLVIGKPLNNTFHLVLTLVTLGAWALVWITLAIFGRPKRIVVSVDEFDITSVVRVW